MFITACYKGLTTLPAFKSSARPATAIANLPFAVKDCGAEKPPVLEREPLPDLHNVRLDFAYPLQAKEALAEWPDKEATALITRFVV